MPNIAQSLRIWSKDIDDEKNNKSNANIKIKIRPTGESKREIHHQSKSMKINQEQLDVLVITEKM